MSAPTMSDRVMALVAMTGTWQTGRQPKAPVKQTVQRAVCALDTSGT